MAKLPTLNVDVAVNTKTMQKGIAEANKKLQQVGGKVLAAGGGVGAKLGSFGSLGGGLGQGAIAIGGVMAAAMAPFKAARMINQAFVDSVADSKKALDAWNTSATEGTRTGIAKPLAERLAMMEDRAARAEGAWSGMGAAFFAGGTNAQGELQGVAGLATTWAEEMGKGLKEVLFNLGAAGSGMDPREQMVLSMMAAEPENAQRLQGWLDDIRAGKSDMPTDDEMKARVRNRAAELEAITARQMRQQQEMFG